MQNFSLTNRYRDENLPENEYVSTFNLKIDRPKIKNVQEAHGFTKSNIKKAIDFGNTVAEKVHSQL